MWKSYSDTFLDNVILQGYWLVIHFLLPIQPVVVLIHKVYDQVTGMLGHAGYEYAPGAMSRSPSLLIGTTFHDDHHKLFRVNFATHFSFWDRLCGTIDPEYDHKIDAITARARAR